MCTIPKIQILGFLCFIKISQTEKHYWLQFVNAISESRDTFKDFSSEMSQIIMETDIAEEVIESPFFKLCLQYFTLPSDKIAEYSYTELRVTFSEQAYRKIKEYKLETRAFVRYFFVKTLIQQYINRNLDTKLSLDYSGA